MLYSENIFDFRQTRAIVDFKNTVLPQRLLAIRSLHLDCPIAIFQNNHMAWLDLIQHVWPYDVAGFWEEA